MTRLVRRSGVLALAFSAAITVGAPPAHARDAQRDDRERTERRERDDDGSRRDRRDDGDDRDRDERDGPVTQTVTTVKDVVDRNGGDVDVPEPVKEVARRVVHALPLRRSEDPHSAPPPTTVAPTTVAPSSSTPRHASASPPAHARPATPAGSAIVPHTAVAAHDVAAASPGATPLVERSTRARPRADEVASGRVRFAVPVDARDRSGSRGLRLLFLLATAGVLLLVLPLASVPALILHRRDGTGFGGWRPRRRQRLRAVAITPASGARHTVRR